MFWEEIVLHRLWTGGRTRNIKRGGYTPGTNPEKSCSALVGITTPQTLNIEGYIKKKKVIVLIYSGSTHNFIHCKIAKELNCFLYPAPECQVMIANGGTSSEHNCAITPLCSFFRSFVIPLELIIFPGFPAIPLNSTSIPMGGVDVVLGVQWLQSLGTIAFNFQEIFYRRKGSWIMGYYRETRKGNQL